MTPQQLKASILQYAIQGKLVEQRAEEGTAEELYQQIQAEKQRLIAEKKIKKEKSLPEITEDEVPFDIPESWKWCRFGELIQIINGDRGKNYPSKDKLSKEGEIPFISAINIEDNTISEDSLLYLSQKQYDLLGSGKLVKGDLVLCIRGSLGKNGVYPFETGAIASSLVIIRSFIGLEMLYKYISTYFDTPLFKQEINNYNNGTAQPNLGARDLAKFIVPLPPLAEQKRIVAKIEELLPLVDRYAAAYEKLEKFNAKFPEDMKKSILQYAIQGKLVEQRPEEGTGEELYQQIQAEKQRLIKEKIIKKEKALAEIADDEIPFDIPESWKWVRLGSITNKLTDGSHNPPPNTGAGYPVISAKNVKNGLITFENVDRFTDEAGFAKENPRTDISCGDIIMGIIGGSIGNIAVYTHEEKVIAQRSIAIIKTLAFTDYIVILLKSPLVQNMLKASAAGSAQGGVYLGTLGNLLIPLPPLAEQKRIVAKLDELLPLCERLK